MDTHKRTQQTKTKQDNDQNTHYKTIRKNKTSKQAKTDEKTNEQYNTNKQNMKANFVE